MDFHSIGKAVILGEVFLVFLGLLLFFWQRIPFLGRLPGDIFVQRAETSVLLSDSQLYHN